MEISEIRYPDLDAIIRRYTNPEILRGREIFWQEKWDTPKLERFPRLIEESTVVLPPPPDSEIWGALDEVLVDIGAERFRDSSIAMPLFARYVSIECKKHICAKPEKNLFVYYKEKLEEDKNG